MNKDSKESGQDHHINEDSRRSLKIEEYFCEEESENDEIIIEEVKKIFQTTGENHIRSCGQ